MMYQAKNQAYLQAKHKANTTDNFRKSIPAKTDHQQFLDILLRADKNALYQFIKESINSNEDVKSLYLDYIQPSLYEIGELWTMHKISIATEHRAIALVEAVIPMLYKHVMPSKKNCRKIVTCTMEGEHHRIGIQMISNLFEMAGWESQFAGSNITSTKLCDVLKDSQPDLLGLSLSTSRNVPTLIGFLRDVVNVFPENRILVGGQAIEGSFDLLQDNFSDIHFLTPDMTANLDPATYL